MELAELHEKMSYIASAGIESLRQQFGATTVVIEVTPARAHGIPFRSAPVDLAALVSAVLEKRMAAVVDFTGIDDRYAATTLQRVASDIDEAVQPYAKLLHPANLATMTLKDEHGALTGFNPTHVERVRFLPQPIA